MYLYLHYTTPIPIHHIIQASKASASRLKSEEEMNKSQEKLAALLAEQEEMENDALKVRL